MATNRPAVAGASYGTALQKAALAVGAVFHLLFGVAGIAMARTFTGARTYLIGGGVIYLVLFIYGMVIDHHSAANFVPVNMADNWLHLALAIGMIALGVLLSRANSGTRAPRDARPAA